MAFKIPLDAYILAIPISYACIAMGGLVWKTVVMDPEMSTREAFDATPEDVLRSKGEQWRLGVKQLFQDRIDKKRFSVFGTNFYGDKQ
jgi:hypothetical protein